MTGRPLEGLVVLDLSRVLAGPLAGMILGDLGADVIKVERPEVGDDTRQWGPPFVSDGAGMTSSYFLSLNRNKRSIALDFKDRADREVLRRLVEGADVLLENFRPAVMDSLGLGHDVLRSWNPELILVSVTGFGHDGPDSDRAGYDQIVQGEAGLMSLTGADGQHPTKIGVPVADIMAGLNAVIGALAGLEGRRRHGGGTVARTSLLAAAVASHTFQAARWLVGEMPPEANGNEHPTLAPYGEYRARDGRFQVAVGNDRQWRSLATIIGVGGDARFDTNAGRVAHRAELNAVLAEQFAGADVTWWIERLREAGLPCGRIRSLQEVYEDEQVQSQGLLLHIDADASGPELRLTGPALRFDGVEVPRRRPPRLDEHGDELRQRAARPGMEERTA